MQRQAYLRGRRDSLNVRPKVADMCLMQILLNGNSQELVLMFAEGSADDSSTDFDKAWKALLTSFAAAAAYTLVASQWPALKSFPVFSWVGLPAATAWGWELAPSMGYIGQGMIMGPRTAVSMLLGAIAGAPCPSTSFQI